MPALLKKVSTITEKGQVTVPKSVREALGVRQGERVAFYVDENLHVSLEKEVEEQDDPVIDNFLTFLAEDMGKYPERLREFPDTLLKRIAEVTSGMTIDPDEQITGDVAI